MRIKKTNRTRLPNSNFSESFKRSVIEDYLRSSCTKQDIKRKYGIKFQSAIQYWMKKYGYEDKHKKVPYLEVLNHQELKHKYSKEKQVDSRDPEEQKAYIKQLERELNDEKLRSESYRSMIEIAEKELKISIRKKSNTK
jgi:transposase-like protein